MCNYGSIIILWSLSVYVQSFLSLPPTPSFQWSCANTNHGRLLREANQSLEYVGISFPYFFSFSFLLAVVVAQIDGTGRLLG